MTDQKFEEAVYVMASAIKVLSRPNVADIEAGWITYLWAKKQFERAVREKMAEMLGSEADGLPNM